MSYYYDNSNDLICIYVDSSTGVTYSFKKDTGSLKEGDVVERKGATVTLNGTENSSIWASTMSAITEYTRQKSYSTSIGKREGISYEGKTLAVVRNSQLISEIIKENGKTTDTSRYLESYTITGGDIEGFTYLGMYYECKTVNITDVTYSDIVFEIRGDESIAGLYTVTEEQFRSV